MDGEVAAEDAYEQIDHGDAQGNDGQRKHGADLAGIIGGSDTEDTDDQREQADDDQDDQEDKEEFQKSGETAFFLCGHDQSSVG